MFNFELPDNLDNFCMQYDCKPIQVFLAALQALLHRYTSQKEIVVGSQTNPESSDSKFVHYQARIESSSTFKDLLDKTQSSETNNPVEILLEALEPKEPGLTPLYEVILNVWDESFPNELDSSEPPYALVFDFKKTNNSFLGRVGTSIRLFDDGLLPRLAKHFVNILESAIHNPEQLISELTLLSQDEHHIIVEKWNDTKAETPGDGFIHHWIESITRENPDSPAVELEGQTLSYLELEKRSNKLANYLLTVGVEPDCCVGIFMSRSFESVIGILAILKAGGAYVPLDPAYPVERLQSIWDELNSPVLITQLDLKNKIDVSDQTPKFSPFLEFSFCKS